MSDSVINAPCMARPLPPATTILHRLPAEKAKVHAR
jgi:hypothetical protein